MDAPREASWLFLTFIGGHAPLLLPPRSKGRGNGAFFLMKMQPIHTEEEHVGWEMLQTIMIFKRYSLPHIGFQQQGYISCSYKVFCRSRQFSKADVLLRVYQPQMLLPSCSFSISTCGPQPLLQGKTTHRLLGATTCKGPRSLLLTFHGSCSQA